MRLSGIDVRDDSPVVNDGRRSRHWTPRWSLPGGGEAGLFPTVAVTVLLGALLAAVLAFFFTWLVLKIPPWGELPAPDADGSSPFLEVLKVALAVVAGIGGAVALVVAYRRQRLAERDDTGLRARYASAAQQLGDEQAAVRLAGVYAMAHLADDWAEQRQQCVDVLCAYLRLPWAKINAAVLEPSTTTTQHSWPDGDGARTVSRTYPGRAGEQEVRKTIIRVIATHVRGQDLHQAQTGPRWSELDLDLTDAVILEADFSNCLFEGKVDFRGAQFSGDALFEHTHFSGPTFFESAQFPCRAAFDNAQFSGNVGFGGAQFTSVTAFSKAQFLGGAEFVAANFAGPTFFNAVQFSRGASFTAAHFSAGGAFNNAQFSGNTSFDFTQFFGDPRFFGAHFFGTAWFNGAQFSTNAWFNGTQFLGDAWFNRAQIFGDTGFDHAQFSGDASFGGTEFSGDTRFDHAQFSGEASFDGAQFDGETSFDGATLPSRAVFERATQPPIPSALSEATFRDEPRAAPEAPPPDAAHSH